MIGIDWVSTGILLVGYAVSNIRSLSLVLRNGVMAAACFGVAGYRLLSGNLVGINVLMVGLATFFGARYAYRALRP